MKHLLSSHIAVGVRQPATKETIDHLQQANIEVFNAMMINIIGDSYDVTKIYVLYGLQLQIGVPSGGLQTITPGAVFCNGEVYLCQGTVGSYPLPGGSVWVANKTTSYYGGANPDPITFSDGSTANVHQSLTLDFAASASGSGTFNGGPSVNNDYTSLIRLRHRFVSRTTLNGDTITFDGSQTIFYSGGVTGTPSFTLDFTNAIEGSEVVFASGLTTVTGITISGTFTPFYPSNFITSYSGKTVVYFRIKFLGTEPLSGANCVTIDFFAV